VCVVKVRAAYVVHDAEHLEGEQVLPEVVAALENDVDGLPQRIGVGEDDPQRRLGRVHRPTLLHEDAVGHHPVTAHRFVWFEAYLQSLEAREGEGLAWTYVGSSGREKLLGRMTLASSS
jgi:hypothetical protein